MYLITLFKVLYAHFITTREGINYDSTGEVSDVIFCGSQADAEACDDLMYSIVRSIQIGDGGCVAIVITR